MCHSSYASSITPSVLAGPILELSDIQGMTDVDVNSNDIGVMRLGITILQNYTAAVCWRYHSHISYDLRGGLRAFFDCCWSMITAE